MSIQSSINSIISSVGAGAVAAKHLQQQKMIAQKGMARDIPRQNQAQQRVATQQEAKKKQKRNFLDYLARQPIAGGGTVGDLPTSAQKQIAAQYSKSERKKLMDNMDKEGTNKNGKRK